MALENEQELVAAMEELRRQMSGLGTEAAKADNALGKFGQNATKIGKEMAGAASQLAQGGGAMRSLGGVVDLTTKAIGGLLGIIPGVGGALKELAGAAGDAAKYVLQQFDDLAKNYQALGESSAIASDGLDGLQRQFRQMGLLSLPAFARAINQNTVGFVALGGSVARGAEQFSELAGVLTSEGVVEKFIALGMNIDGVGESAGKYVAAFSRFGLLQAKTFNELQASTQKYLLEVDQIARITGATRRQQEDEQQKSLANVRFRAQIQLMRDQGLTDEAAQLEAFVRGLTGPLADAARAYATGIPLTEEAAMADIVLLGAMRDSIQAIKDGSQATTELTRIQKGASQGVKTFGGVLALAGDITQGAGAQILDFAAINERAAELEAQGLGASDARAKAEQEALIRQQGSTKGFVDAQVAVAGSARDLQNLSFTIVKNVIPAVDAFASGLKKVTGFIDKNFGGTPSARPESMGGAKPVSGPVSQTQREFMESMYKTLLAEATKQGVKNPEVIARLGVAQSALETGYGRRLAGGNNYFGIKGGTGPGMATQEYINGQMVTTTDRFRRYGSMQESAADYVKFLTENKRYKGVLGAGTLEEAIAAQGRTGYATDPRYASKLTDIASSFDPTSSTAVADNRNKEEAQMGLLARINDTLERLNQTATAQVDVSRNIYRATM